MSTNALVTVACTECRDAYATFKSQSERPPFLCRRCRLVSFAEAVEELLTNGPLGAETCWAADSQEHRDTVLAQNTALLVVQLQELRELHLGD